MYAKGKEIKCFVHAIVAESVYRSNICRKKVSYNRFKLGRTTGSIIPFSVYIAELSLLSYHDKGGWGV